MKRRLVYSRDATAELTEIKTYTISEWGHVQARQYVAALVEDVKGLRTGALRQPMFDDVYPGLRRKRSGMHHIYYRTFPDRIEVIRIMHVQRDPGLHLRAEGWSEEE